jgi:purine-nucleoside phosphorylase
MTSLHDRLRETADTLIEKTGVAVHDVVAVFGSGLGDYPTTLAGTIAVPYGDLPGFPLPTAVGHSGTAYSVKMGENRVLLLAGRPHAYEGHSMETVTFPVRTAIMAGARKVLLTNAAGGLDDGIEPGDLVLLTDHINFAGMSPLMGANDERLGPRFPDMTDVYTPALRAKAHAAASRVGLELKEAIYLWWHGPMFETPAEIRMAKMLGAGLIGMSTVPEATAARHMGAQVLGLSLCTNLAAGISQNPITAEEVIEAAAQASDRLRLLLDELLPSL